MTVLLGYSVPEVLRPVNDHFECIGELYTEGIMYGEAMEALGEGHAELRDFDLH